MFNEDEDWNDAADLLSERSLQKTPNNSDSININSKSVGKKSLLRTLQTLGSVPDWKDDDVCHLPDSDSEDEATRPHTKRKKKRRKRTKQGTTTEEQNDNMDVKEKKIATKIKKTGVPKAKNTTAGKTKSKETPKLEKQAGDMQKLNRQQWKNKMKNKRKCKNKYQPNNCEKEVETASKPLQTTRLCVSKNKQFHQAELPDEKKSKKPQKRKNTEKETETIPKKRANKKGVIAKCDEVVMNGYKKEADKIEVKPQMSKAEMLKREQLRKILQRHETEKKEEEEAAAVVVAASEKVTVADEGGEKPDRSASLRSRMEQRLESARFRYINEVLYSSTSGAAVRMFQQDPDAFWVYHRGYTAQVQRWPTNPVDAIIAYIRQKSSSLVVADFGCGDCKIGRSVKNKVHSFDLAATCDLVTVCDMANVPLKDSSVDIAVFCLSLMGTNLADFIAEANRVLKKGGVLKVAEVASRFDDVRSFLSAMAKLGFKMASKDTANTHFYSFEFVKTGNASENLKKIGLQLKACLYKKR
ncbi:ribosomal RNA-processing protein 8 [Entelurus aequoreus]|uniref:ribosomal RNA-processing protein 8 n=1 Tax=Entelurus aequoreus TaxID=161455 RepID=UPI002B1E60D3|nr:ribosomal RNA-processing protein 8 [Entelurus aequoreus]XP_061916394.1 ribosomal RNA-processing protein 8 [Entelurus aequoreus]